MVTRRTVAVLAAGLSLIVAAKWPAQPQAQQSPTPTAFAEMRWRPIGPFRGGRTKAITGVRTQPNVFYMSQALPAAAAAPRQPARRRCRPSPAR